MSTWSYNLIGDHPGTGDNAADKLRDSGIGTYATQQANNAVNASRFGVAPALRATGATAGATAGTTATNKWDQGGAMNPYTRISNVKSQPIQTRLDQILSDFDKFRTDNASTVSGITADTATARGNMRANNDQEGATIGNFYNGGVQGQLDSIMAKKQAALDAIAKRMSLETQGQINRRMAMGGTTGSGYLDKIKANAMARIGADEANAMSDQEIKNLQWLSGMQAALSGKRQDNETSWAKLGTLPLTSNIASNEAMINALAGITGIDARNNDYGVVREYNGNFIPEQYGGSPNIPRVNGGGMGPNGGYGGASASGNGSPSTGNPRYYWNPRTQSWSLTPFANDNNASNPNSNIYNTSNTGLDEYGNKPIGSLAIPGSFFGPYNDMNPNGYLGDVNIPEFPFV